MREINYNEIKEELVNKAKKMLSNIELHNMEVEFVLLDKNNVENSQVIVMYEDSSFGHVLVPHKDEFLDTLEWDYSMDSMPSIPTWPTGRHTLPIGAYTSSTIISPTRLVSDQISARVFRPISR